MLDQMKLPNALLIGAQKAGTTSLFDWIAQHPQVFANSAIKDCPFFWHDATFQKGFKFYDAFFEGASDEQVLLGGNVNDLFFENAPERIHQLNPAMRLIICLRNPVERAYSAYAYAVERGHENRNFAEAIRQELAGCRYDNLIDRTQKEYIEHGRYWTQIQRYLSLFVRSRLHVVFFEDIKEQPERVVKEVYRFLGIDDGFTPTLSKKNVTGNPAQFSRLNKAIFDYSLKQPWWWAALKRIFSKELRYKLRRGLMSLQRKGGVAPPPPDPETIKSLSDYFKEEVVAMELLAGRDLSHWK